MNITQLRNATIVIEYDQHVLMVDPMLAAKGQIPALRRLVRHPVRNPIVDLPDNADAILKRVNGCLITHCQKGHFDHLDRKAGRWLREHRIPVFCTEADSDFLGKRGFAVREIPIGRPSPFLGGTITTVPCLHGRGLVGRLMAHGSGFVIRWPDQPSLYLAGDTVLTDDVLDCIVVHRPDVSVIPAGGARFDIGGDIIMGMEDAITFGQSNPRVTVANHLEALDHCPVTRDSLRTRVTSTGLAGRFLVPFDGETMTFSPT